MSKPHFPYFAGVLFFSSFLNPSLTSFWHRFGSTFGPEHTTRHSRGARGTFQSITWPETFQDLHNILQALLNILQALPSNGLLVAIQLYKMVVQAAKILNYWIPLFGTLFATFSKTFLCPPCRPFLTSFWCTFWIPSGPEFVAAFCALNLMNKASPDQHTSTHHIQTIAATEYKP